MADYAYKIIAQPWRRDPYYVASSQRKEHLEVVATNEDEARKEARKLLPEINQAFYWRFFVQERVDLRILAAREPQS